MSEQTRVEQLDPRHVHRGFDWDKYEAQYGAGSRLAERAVQAEVVVMELPGPNTEINDEAKRQSASAAA
jgi:hypothetical protein